MECFAGRYFCTIDTSGDVYPCTHLIGEFPAKNAATLGFEECFRGLDRHACKACYQVCHNEFNMLFALRPTTVANHIELTLRSLGRRGRRHG